jgi:regulator of CtrA degradation
MSAGPVAANLLRISSLLDESIALALDLRAYLDLRSDRPIAGGPELAMLTEARELAQLSASLGYCLAWLVTREAVHAGELSRHEARDPGYRLGGAELHYAEHATPAASVSAPLAALALRGRRLYERVARLDGQARPADTSGCVVSTAVSL